MVDHASGSPANSKASVSWASSPAVRKSMQSNRSRDTLLEVRVRSALHKAGLRFRKNIRPVPGFRCSADVVFPGERVAVFIDGCFWHSCPTHQSVPQTNADWWRAKLDATKERDRMNTRLLQQAGWSVLRVWEHESVPDIVASVQRVLVAARQA
jgi:DNA mismatch endonuclease (patch repair protein)